MKSVIMAAIIKNQPLLNYNTFAINAMAKNFITLHSFQEAVELVHTHLHTYQQYMILGGGSNVLFTDDYQGLVIHVAMKGLDLLEDNKEMCRVKVAAGEDWPTFVDYCVDKGWGGVENLALIPGQVGATPVQNIGAYGREVKDVIEKVEAIDLKSGEVHYFSNKECAFGYRDSVFKNSLKDQYLITAVTFRLYKDPVFYLDYGSIREEVQKHQNGNVNFKTVAEAVKRIRRRKLPDTSATGSAGSFFKNPVVDEDKFEQLRELYPEMPFFKVEGGYKIPAGWMIEKCGWRGYRKDNYGVYPDQALVLVNYGGAPGKAIYELSERIREDVVQQFGIFLLREVTVIPAQHVRS